GRAATPAAPPGGRAHPFPGDPNPGPTASSSRRPFVPARPPAAVARTGRGDRAAGTTTRPGDRRLVLAVRPRRPVAGIGRAAGRRPPGDATTPRRPGRSADPHRSPHRLSHRE